MLEEGSSRMRTGNFEREKWRLIVKGTLCRELFNKSSAVAEMGDRGHNRHGPKRGGLLCPFCEGELGPV